MPDPSSVQDVFDVRKVRRLVELMKEYDLAEMDLKQGETRIQLRRGGAAPVAVAMPLPAQVPAQAPTATEKATAVAAASTEPSNIKLITSPMVGTFYSAADPQSPPFVKVGDHVGPDTTVCIVEAMKVFNQIPAEVSGKITAILAENGQTVEFGQPLFKVAVGE